MPAMSPRTQQLQAGMTQGPDQESALFEQGMSEMAYNLLSSRMPDVMQDVVTFKVLDIDIDKGTGVGAFIVLREGSPIYIPVVMVDNAIKPLEVFFHKGMNVFLPLNKGWLDEIGKNALASLGQGIKTPETLYTDVDIRNVVVPPITGRFSYASWVPKAIFDLARVFSSDRLEKTAGEAAPMLPSLLAAAPNRLKVAYTKLLEKNPRLMKQAAATYGMTALAAALQPRLEKIAAKQQHGGALWIADADNTPTDFKRIFGDKAGEAYTGVRKKGFAAKDERLNRNMAVQEQPYAQWTEPNQPGCYTLYASDGKERHAFVMPNPIDLFDVGTPYGRRPAVPSRTPREKIEYGIGRPTDHPIRREYDAKPYLAVFDNGDYIEPNKLVGRDDVADDVAGSLHKRLFVDVSGSPKVGKGFFVRQKGTTFQATVPFEIKSISTGSDSVRRIKATEMGGYNEKTIATDPANPYSTIWMPKGADVVYLPTDFLWIPLKERLSEKSWFQSALDLQACVSNMLSSVGAKKVAIKDAGAKQFSINGTSPLGFVPALKKLAHGCGISVDDAEALLVKAASDRTSTAWIATGEQLARVQVRLDKLAADNVVPQIRVTRLNGHDPHTHPFSSQETDAVNALIKHHQATPGSNAASLRAHMHAAGFDVVPGHKTAADDDKKKSDNSDKDKPKKKAPPSDGPPGGDPSGGDPSMGGDPNLGQDAAMAAMGPPPAPPPPAPLDLAAMEMDQHIQQEMQKLVEKQQTIQMLLQRSSEIAGGAPPAPSVQTQAMGAPPSSMNLATGQPGMQPGMTAGMGQPPQDPSQMGGAAVPPGMPPGGAFPPAAGDPSMMGGPPGMDPSQGMDPSMGGQPGMDPSQGMDPSMMGGQPPQPGMDPSMGQPQPPPMAMMPPDGPNAQTLPQEVNPQFLDQAAQLHSADMFDAAAVATLAQSPALHGVVGQYLPNLEKAVDNLARVLLTLWMQEGDLKPQIGEQTFSGIEENLQTTFKGLGDLVLRLSRGVQSIKDPDNHAT